MRLEIPRADFYHVGLHKTGSTYLSSQIFPLFDDVNLRRQDHALYGNFYEWEANARHMVLFANNFISGEPDQFNPESINQVGAANPGARIILGIRSQETMLRSIYWLCVKTGDGRCFDQFVDDIIDNRKLDYASLAEGYRQQFGNENVLVLLFEEVTQSPHLTVARLAEFFQVPNPDFRSDDTTPVKVTPGDLEIELRRRLNASAARRGRGDPQLTFGRTGKALLAAAHWGDKTHKRLTGRRMNRVRIADQDSRLEMAFGEANRKLFAMLYDTPYASAYPGLSANTIPSGKN